jgi:hypothetical protein
MTPSSEAIAAVWTWSLAIFVVVLVVVAILLTLILRAAKDIQAGLALIWNTGQRVANNTIQLSLLSQTNDKAAAILASAVGVVNATAAVQSHAETCPRCPTCVIGSGWQS